MKGEHLRPPKFVVDVGLEVAIQVASGEKVNIGSAVKSSAVGVLNPAKTVAKAAKLAKITKKAHVVGASTKIAPKLGSMGGPGAGKAFSETTKDAARAASGNKCVFCGTKTVRSSKPTPNRSNIDHAVPKSRGGNNTSGNAQNTCQTCNLQKGAKTTAEFTTKYPTGIKRHD